MDKQKFDDLGKKATGFLGEGVRVLKDGLREAGKLISATADATKMHIEKESHVLGTHREYHRLGEVVYNMIKADPKISEIKINGSMREIIKRIKHAESEIQKHNEQLSHMTVVQTPEPPVKPRSKAAVRGSASKSVPRKAGRKTRAAKKKS